MSPSPHLQWVFSEQHELGVEEVEKEIETAGIEQVVIGCEMEADVPVSDDIDFSSVLLEPKSGWLCVTFH